MSSRNKKRLERPTAAGGGALREEVERLFAKDRLKEAVKEAKLCFRAEETPENHRLLERAYLLRADQLRRKAMPTAAKEVAEHLLEFGVTDPALVEESAELFLSLGMSREAKKLEERIDSPEVRERFARQEADVIVIHPERTGTAQAEVRQAGQAVRAAIEAVQRGDEANGLGALREISRGSPFADWKLFVRGLAAHLRRDEAEAQANWDRLDPDRAAVRIARVLQVLAGPSSAAESAAGDGAKVKLKLDAMERQVYGVAVLEPLEQLRALLAEDRWDDAVRQIGSLRNLLTCVDPALGPRLTRILYAPLIRAASQRDDYREAKALVKAFTYAAERLPIDPHWNRLWALIWEGPQGGFVEAQDYWRKYLGDIESLPGLKPSERSLAEALVLMRLGERCANEADAIADAAEAPMRRRSSGREVDAERERAIAFFEDALKRAPNHRPIYHALTNAYKGWDRPDDVAVVARRLLEKFPDDFDAVMLLATHHFKREEPDLALQYGRQARALKPLDEQADVSEWAIHLLRARVLALKGRWDDGRAEFEEAERLQPEKSQSLHVRARRAVFEFKAGQAERAESLIADTQVNLSEATPLWLTLLIESIRYKLPKPERERFESRWSIAQSKKVRSDTAGALAELMAAFVGDEVEYPGRAGHLKEVVAYLRRTTRIKYAYDDLSHVCSLLGLLPKEAALLQKLVARGIKLFPNSPLFLLLTGAIELEKGPYKGGNLRLAQSNLEKALKQAETSSHPMDVRLLPQIRQTLSMLKDTSFNMVGMPFSPFGPGSLPGGPGIGSFRDFLDSLGDMFKGGPDDDEFDDEFDDEPLPPLPRKTGSGRKVKRKKG